MIVDNYIVLFIITKFPEKITIEWFFIKFHIQPAIEDDNEKTCEK